MKQMTYNKAREFMSPGDVIAFGGKGFVSEIIKLKTACNVSHVGIVLQSQIPTIDGFINQIIESTSLGDGFAGVQINRLSTRINQYDGEVWWLPIRKDIRQYLNFKDFFEFCLAQEGKEYDAPQAIFSAIDLLPDQSEDHSKMFCSELNTAALKAGFKKALAGVHLIDIEPFKTINTSEQTPADVCSFKIYDAPIQLSGNDKELFIRIDSDDRYL